MENNESRNLDLFHADMLALDNLNTQEMMAAEDADWTPVPRDYWGMSFGDVVAEIEAHAFETFLAERARQERPYNYR